MKKYIWNLLQALDRLVNTIFAGTDKEYISSRVYRYKDDSQIAFLVYTFLNWIKANHCEEAYIDSQIGFDPNDDVWK